MNRRAVPRASLLLAFVVLGAATPVRAQLSQLDWALDGGVVLPLFSFGEYFEFGPTVGLDVGYPLHPRMDLKLDLDLDVINRHEFYPTPIMKAWRYRLGVEADVLGDEGSDSSSCERVRESAARPSAAPNSGSRAGPRSTASRSPRPTSPPPVAFAWAYAPGSG